MLICRVGSICVGRHLADATIWITIVSVLAFFDISKAKDESGRDIDVPGTFSDEVATSVHSCFIPPFLLNFRISQAPSPIQVFNHSSIREGATYSSNSCECRSLRISYLIPPIFSILFTLRRGACGGFHCCILRSCNLLWNEWDSLYRLRIPVR